MKARLIRRSETMLQLLFKNGKIKTVTLPDVIEFFKSYKDETHYEGGTWDFELSMEEFDGDTLAIVNDEGQLLIYDSDFLCAVLDYKETKELRLLTSTEYGELHGKKAAMIRKHCTEGRIPGAVLKGKEWIIPENAPYPIDGRTKARKKTSSI